MKKALFFLLISILLISNSFAVGNRYDIPSFTETQFRLLLVAGTLPPKISEVILSFFTISDYAFNFLINNAELMWFINEQELSPTLSFNWQVDVFLPLMFEREISLLKTPLHGQSGIWFSENYQWYQKFEKIEQQIKQKKLETLQQKKQFHREIK